MDEEYSDSTGSELDEDYEDSGEEDSVNQVNGISRHVYLPTGDENEELEFDEEAYEMFHKFETGYPCMSFDVLPDGLGYGIDRFKEDYQTAYLLAGTSSLQAERNSIFLLRASQLKKINDNDDEENSDDDEEKDPDVEEAVFDWVSIPHHGDVNRIRAANLSNHLVAASWSDQGVVHLWDLQRGLEVVENEYEKQIFNNSAPQKPFFSFNGHMQEGYALDWSPKSFGYLATGDCKKSIHIWRPLEAGTWHVDQQPLIGHTQSVEDIQWSPTEGSVLISCSVDRSIRAWDIRSSGKSACVATIADAHETDINGISWNRVDTHFLLSGCDDGFLKTWDLRKLGNSNGMKPIVSIRHHLKPITSLEWHPTESSVFAASSDDNQISLWDLSVEKDEEEEVKEEDEEDEQLNSLPPQLMFIHQGQIEIKEIHWHKQLPSVLISTASTGFDLFKTVNI